MDGQMDVRDTTREVVQRYKEREASSGYSSSERDLPIWSLILFMLFVLNPFFACGNPQSGTCNHNN